MRLGKRKRSKDIYGWDGDNQPQPRKMHKGVRVMRDSQPAYLSTISSLVKEQQAKNSQLVICI